MAGHYQTGVNSIQRGDLLVATPKLNKLPWRRSVVLLTEVSPRSVMGTILNRPTMMTTDDVTDLAIPRTQVYMGGPISNGAMFMLHTPEFQSSNTLDITSTWSVSSDDLMFEKLSMGQTPTWYRFYMGAAGWHPQQLDMEINMHDAWMIINNPSFELVTADPTDQWSRCVDSISSSMFSNYF